VTEEERADGIREVMRLLSEVEAMAHYQVIQVQKLRSLLVDIEERLKQVEGIEDRDDGLAGGGEFMG
jgi:hypothetical protein